MIANRMVLLAVVTSFACMESAGPEDASPLPQPPVLTGRYTGRWEILVQDTTIVCGIPNCSFRTLAYPSCDLTIDITMPTPRTYAGQFAIDTLDACDEATDAGDLRNATFLRLATTGTLTAVFDTTFHNGGPHVALTVGDGSPAVLESLVGCTLVSAVTGWEFWVVGGDAIDAWKHRPESRSILLGIAVAGSERLPEFRYVCQGRLVILEFRFWAERP